VHACAHGPHAGSAEERTALVAQIKAQLRGHAPAVLQWLNTVSTWAGWVSGVLAVLGFFLKTKRKTSKT
jgi:hypothetical protein